VIEEIMSSEKSALLAYHLAKNPDKLNALNQMSGRELAREMGRLEATVRMPEAKKQHPLPLRCPARKAAPALQALKRTCRHGSRKHTDREPFRKGIGFNG
jgi:hypothetical protein